MAGRRPYRPRRDRDVKDRLVQTRVPERLETVLKEEAKKRRLSVSHLIRNVLEDTLHLVDTVVTGSEELASGSVRLAEQVARDATRVASTAREVVRGRTREDEGKSPARRRSRRHGAAPLDHVLAWNAVVLNQSAQCARCERELTRGSPAHLGLSQDPRKPPAWLCPECLATLD